MPASAELHRRLLAEIMGIAAVDVHSHVPPHAPFARSLRELLGYHYYTELAHSAGMPVEVVRDGRPDDEMIPELLAALAAVDNTVQYGWLIELARELFGFREPRLTPANWRPLADAVARAAGRPDRARELLARAGIERVFLTNSPDEPLEGIDTALFVPSLRADDLVLRLHEAPVRQMLEREGGRPVADAASLAEALGALVERFAAHGARSVALSLPPGATARRVGAAEVGRALDRAGRGACGPDDHLALQSGVLFALCGACMDHGLPLQVMYGVVRGTYEHGVPQGRDLPAAGASLQGLLPLLNAFPDVTFCLSVLSESQAQELASYGWIMRNVVLSGHWWYTNVPEYIAFELGARLQSVPKTKLIGYYSDMYKLEFGLPKFGMYRRVLAHVLAGHFVEPGYGTEEDAVALARLLLRDNAVRIFGLKEESR